VRDIVRVEKTMSESDLGEFEEEKTKWVKVREVKKSDEKIESD